MNEIEFGSVEARAREDRAKSMHGWPPMVGLVDSSAVMPADDPSGRGCLQVVLSLDVPLITIESPIAPVLGLVASQLYRWGFELDRPALKSCENWSNTNSMVSEPTPAKSAGFGTVLPGGSASAGPAVMAVIAAAAVAATISLLTIRNFPSS